MDEAPDKEELASGPRPETERSQKRQLEEHRYMPVIIKRNDESTRHPDDVLEKSISEGAEQLKRPVISLFLSALSAGLILGFAALSVALAVQLAGPDGIDLKSRFFMALVYPLGFIICIMSGTQLFTEHTALAVYPVLDRRAGIPSLLKLWGVVFAGNILGTFISSWLLSIASSVTGASAGHLMLAHHVLEGAPVSLFVSAVLAGWLMAQGGWLILATPPSIAQMACVYIVTFLIGICGFHHSIAGSAEIFTAWFLYPEEIAFGHILRFLALVGCGNLVGGSLMVAILNYGHIRKTQELET